MHKRTDLRKILIIGSGPIVIGQACEFDYSATQACKTLRQEGYSTVLVNSDPATVMTDSDTSDATYIEPLTVESVAAIIRRERPNALLPTLGGQTALNLTIALSDSGFLEECGVEIIGTNLETIKIAQDRMRLRRLLANLRIPQPENGMASTVEEARQVAARLGYPLLVRTSPGQAGRAKQVIYNKESFDQHVSTMLGSGPAMPIWIDKFLERAAEFDVDALADENVCVIAGILEHIEEAGIHSGDSSCVLPPLRVDPEHMETMRHYTRMLAQALSVCGLLNIQFAIKNNRVYVLDVNPRASRTVPFVSRATGVPLARIAALVMAGQSLETFGLPAELTVPRFFIKSPVFPIAHFPEVDPMPGLEMHSTGEVMGIGETFGEAYGKAMMGTGLILPYGGAVLISVNDPDKGQAVLLARRLARLGFKLMATMSTAIRLREVGLEVESVFKIDEGRPNIVDCIERSGITLIINTPPCRAPHHDELAIRQAALQHNIPCVTTMSAAHAIVEAITTHKGNGTPNVRSLQELHAVPTLALAYGS